MGLFNMFNKKTSSQTKTVKKDSVPDPIVSRVKERNEKGRASAVTPKGLIIAGARILSVSEARKYPQEVLEHKQEYWLAGKIQLLSHNVDPWYACVCRRDGKIDDVNGRKINAYFVWVRPLLVLENTEEAGLKIGDHFIFGGLVFRVMSPTTAFCLEDIGEHHFNRYDPAGFNLNHYSESKLRITVLDWLTDKAQNEPDYTVKVKKPEPPNPVDLSQYSNEELNKLRGGNKYGPIDPEEQYFKGVEDLLYIPRKLEKENFRTDGDRSYFEHQWKEEALTWIKAAADQGHARAIYLLTKYSSFSGYGIKECIKAASLGCVKAMTAVSTFGVETYDFGDGEEWLTQAMSLGSVEAMLCYFGSAKVKYDDHSRFNVGGAHQTDFNRFVQTKALTNARSVIWRMIAAGYPDGYYLAGTLFDPENGGLVSQYDDALSNYSKAAKAGSHLGMYCLGDMICTYGNAAHQKLGEWLKNEGRDASSEYHPERNLNHLYLWGEGLRKMVDEFVDKEWTCENFADEIHYPEDTEEIPYDYPAPNPKPEKKESVKPKPAPKFEPEPIVIPQLTEEEWKDRHEELKEKHKKESEVGDLKALVSYGRSIENENKDEAFSLYQKAIDAGEPFGYTAMGDYYSTVVFDDKRAFEYYKLAYEGGDANGSMAYASALIYSPLGGKTEDIALAKEIFAKIASYENPFQNRAKKELQKLES